MPDLLNTLPLMRPVYYNGQEYFTSQYFHQQYIVNSQKTGKYREHKVFLKMLRSIEAYALYLAQSDIVELSYQQAKTYWNHFGASDIAPLFQATGYQPLSLMNATAQAALSHHLDDESSKEMSVAINTTIAQQAKTHVLAPPAMIPALPLPMTSQEHIAFLQSCVNGLIALGVFDDRDRIEFGARVRQVADASMRQITGAAPATGTTEPLTWTLSMRLQALRYPLLKSPADDGLQIRIGSAAKKSYVDTYGEDPPKIWDHVKGQKRLVNAYPADRLDVLDATIVAYLGQTGGQRPLLL